MTVRRLVLAIGAVLLPAGVIALLAPVPNAISESVANVPILNQGVPHADYVAQCQSSGSQRRAWSIPLAIVGVIVVAGSFAICDSRAIGANPR